MAVSVEVGGGEGLFPLIVNITQTAPLSSEVRHYYAGGALADNFTALGLIVEDSPLGRMMGDVFSRMMDKGDGRDSSSGIQTRVFTDEESAVAWLTSTSERR